MKELKAKIIMLKYLKLFFYCIFVLATIGFFFFSTKEGSIIIKNGFIFAFLMSFSLCSAEVCNYQIKAFIKEFKVLKSRKKKIAKIYEFNKIA